MDEAEARRRFTAAPVARLATVGADGRPHLVPVTFAVDGDTLWSAVDHKPKSSRSLRRAANIADNPCVSVLVDHYEDDWARLWWVRADGLASVGDDVGGVDALVEKYDEYRLRRPEGPTITVEVTAWRWWAAR